MGLIDGTARFLSGPTRGLRPGQWDSMSYILHYKTSLNSESEPVKQKCDIYICV